jgi:hypothetical protein
MLVGAVVHGSHGRVLRGESTSADRRQHGHRQCDQQSENSSNSAHGLASRRATISCQTTHPSSDVSASSLVCLASCGANVSPITGLPRGEVIANSPSRLGTNYHVLI